MAETWILSPDATLKLSNFDCFRFFFSSPEEGIFQFTDALQLCALLQQTSVCSVYFSESVL